MGYGKNESGHLLKVPYQKKDWDFYDALPSEIKKILQQAPLPVDCGKEYYCQARLSGVETQKIANEMAFTLMVMMVDATRKTYGQDHPQVKSIWKMI